MHAPALGARRPSLSKSDQVMREIERLGSEVVLPIIGPRKGKILADIVRKAKPKRVLEIGAFLGYSAILMGEALPPDAELITIEIDAKEAKIAAENIIKAEMLPKLKVIAGDAIKIIPELEGAFDLVFIDAEKREYLRYLLLVEGKLHSGSVIVADNVGISASELRDYLNYVRHSRKYRSKYVPVDGDALEVSKKL
jgi:caffeoyl-CoA O-methyltransferase